MHYPESFQTGPHCHNSFPLDTLDHTDVTWDNDLCTVLSTSYKSEVERQNATFTLNLAK
jgi:hypothetical protein